MCIIAQRKILIFLLLEKKKKKQENVLQPMRAINVKIYAEKVKNYHIEDAHKSKNLLSEEKATADYGNTEIEGKLKGTRTYGYLHSKRGNMVHVSWYRILNQHILNLLLLTRNLLL